MKWNRIHDAARGHGVDCSVCQTMVEECYVPSARALTQEQRELIERRWSPFETFLVCRECLQEADDHLDPVGHLVVVRSLS